MESRPFLKWAGGKTQLLPVLLEVAPRKIGTYYEPFAGAGALFFALTESPRHSVQSFVLNDLNARLMTTYAAVRDLPGRLVVRLDEMQEHYSTATPEERERYFYEVRSLSPRDRVETAALLIFLNKTCYNGLYRENRKGKFNVPFGRYDAPAILDLVAIQQASRALQGVVLQRGEFTSSCASAQEGDFVYFDPPFHPLTSTANFTTYTGRDFGRRDQSRLRTLLDSLTARDVKVMLSNSPHPWIQELYADPRYTIREIPSRRMINSRGDRRGPIGELVITNYPSDERP